MTDGRTDRQTDGQGDYYRTPSTSSGGALTSYTLQRTRVTKFYTVTFIRELGFIFKSFFPEFYTFRNSDNSTTSSNILIWKTHFSPSFTYTETR